MPRAGKALCACVGVPCPRPASTAGAGGGKKKTKKNSKLKKKLKFVFSLRKTGTVLLNLEGGTWRRLSSYSSAGGAAGAGRRAATSPVLPCKVTQKQPKTPWRDSANSRTLLTAPKPGGGQRRSPPSPKNTHTTGNGRSFDTLSRASRRPRAP